MSKKKNKVQGDLVDRYNDLYNRADLASVRLRVVSQVLQDEAADLREGRLADTLMGLSIITADAVTELETALE